MVLGQSYAILCNANKKKVNKSSNIISLININKGLFV